MRVLFSTLAALWAGPAAAFCGTFVSSPGVELTNKTSQVIISRQGERTTLTMANDYKGPVDDFAMLVPVPYVLEEDDIATARPELFQRFNDYSAPRVVEYECADFYGYEDDGDFGGYMDGGGGYYDYPSEEADPDVVVEAEYSVGIYEIVILSAETAGGLMEWLEENGYGVDASAQALLTEYIEGGQLFFAAKINGEMLSFDEDGATVLEPLQFGYNSDVLSLPIRLGTLNSPGEQDVILYILTDEDDGQVKISNYTEVNIEDECMVDITAAGGASNHYGNEFGTAWAEAGTGEAWINEYAWSTSSCDPCPTEPPNESELEEAGYTGDRWNSFFTRLRIRFTPEAATEPIMMYTSGIRSTEQIRFIDYNTDMEDRFEVCGVGMIDEPGNCDEYLEELYGESDTDADGGSDGAGGDAESEDGSGESGGGSSSGGGSGGTMSDGSGLGAGEGADSTSDDGGKGCSHAAGHAFGWSWVLGLLALVGRRHQRFHADG